MIRLLLLLSLSTFIYGCGDSDGLDPSEDVVFIVDPDDGNVTEVVVPADTETVDSIIPPTVATPTPPPAASNSTVFFIPDNCSNPPQSISSNDGFQCIASRTRGESIVCLLPFQFTWQPLTPFRDDAGNVFGCNANDDFFDQVTLVLTSGEQISLVESGCFNFVSTANGQIGRQHWRNELVQFDSVAGALDLIIMTRDGQSTCLNF